MAGPCLPLSDCDLLRDRAPQMLLLEPGPVQLCCLFPGVLYVKADLLWDWGLWSTWTGLSFLPAHRAKHQVDANEFPRL